MFGVFRGPVIWQVIRRNGMRAGNENLCREMVNESVCGRPFVPVRGALFVDVAGDLAVYGAVSWQ
jgi:hypothetical protein